MRLSSPSPAACRGGLATASASSKAALMLWKPPAPSTNATHSISLQASTFASGDVSALAADSIFRSRLWMARHDTDVLQLFDAEDGALLREVRVQLPASVLAMAVAKTTAWILTRTEREGGGGKENAKDTRGAGDEVEPLRLWSVDIGADEKENMKNKAKRKKRMPKGMLKTFSRAEPVASRDGCGVAFFQRNWCFFWRGDGARAELPLKHTKFIRCVALHPQCTSLAAGDETGRVVVWHIGEAVLDDIGIDDTDVHMDAPKEGNGNDNDSRRRGPHVTMMSEDHEIHETKKKKKKKKNRPSFLARVPASDAIKRSTYHWHASSVRCMSFTADGRRLLTGGDERVLVAWDLENGGTQSFYPRIGASIHKVFPDELDEARAWCVCGDNSVVLIGLATKTIIAQGGAIKPRPEGLNTEWMLRLNDAGAGTSTRAGDEVRGQKATLRTKNVLIAAPDVAVQRCDYVLGEHRGTMPVAPRTIAITPIDASGSQSTKTAASSAAVILATECLHGDAMVTVDVRPAGDVVTADVGDDSWGGTHRVCCLRFWERAKKRGAGDGDWASSMSAVTVTDDPHEGGTVVDLCGAGHEGVVASICDRGIFKIWSKREFRRTAYFDPPTSSMRSHWICSASGSYKQLPFASLAFSPDASVLAIGTASAAAHPVLGGSMIQQQRRQEQKQAQQPPLLTLWDAHRTELATVVACAYSSFSGALSVEWLAFVGGNHGGDPRIAVLVRKIGALRGDAGVIAVHSLLSPGTPRWTLRLDSVTARPSASPSCSSVAVSCRTTPKAPSSTASGEEGVDAKDLILVLDASAHSARSAIRRSFKTRRPEGTAALLCGYGEVVVMTRERRFDVGRIGTHGDDDSGGNVTAQSVNGRGALGVRDESAVSMSSPALFANVYGSLASELPSDASASPAVVVPDALPVPNLPAPGIAPWRSLFDAPSHVLPPMSDLVLPFLGAYTSSSSSV